MSHPTTEVALTTAEAREVLGRRSDLAESITQLYPGIVEIASLARAVSESASYPINSFDDLQLAIGGADTIVSVAGRQLPVGGLRRLVPPYYFPIGDHNDLVSKFNHLWRIHNQLRCN